MILFNGDPEVFTRLLELEVRGFVASMFAFAKELVRFSSLQVVEDDTLVVAELHAVFIKKCDDCFNPSKSFFEISDVMHLPSTY